MAGSTTATSVSPDLRSRAATLMPADPPPTMTILCFSIEAMACPRSHVGTGQGNEMGGVHQGPGIARAVDEPYLSTSTTTFCRANVSPDTTASWKRRDIALPCALRPERGVDHRLRCARTGVPSEDGWSGAVRLRDRPAHLHRVPCVHRGVQDRARGPGRTVPDLGEVRRPGHLPLEHPRFRGDALQPLHRRPVREDVSDPGAVQARGRDRRLRSGPLHRLQELHAGLPVRRDLHRRGHPHRREVQLLRPPRRRGPRAGVRGGVPDSLDLGR